MQPMRLPVSLCRSNTAFTPDNYTQEHTHDQEMPEGWLHRIKGHPCFTPGKVRC